MCVFGELHCGRFGHRPLFGAPLAVLRAGQLDAPLGGGLPKDAAHGRPSGDFVVQFKIFLASIKNEGIFNGLLK
jgi:hypothetical protein